MTSIISQSKLPERLRMIVQRLEPATGQNLAAIASRIIAMGSATSQEVCRVTGLLDSTGDDLALSDPDQLIPVLGSVTLVNCNQDSGLVQSASKESGLIQMTDYSAPNFSNSELLRVVTTDPTGRILLDAFQDEKAFDTSRDQRKGAYFSRTQFRETGDGTWVKGMTSGMTQEVLDIGVLSNNSVLMVVNQKGGAACHDGTESCFYRRLYPDGFLRPIMRPVADPSQMYSSSKSLDQSASVESGDLSEIDRVSLWLLALSEKIQSRLEVGNPESFVVREVLKGDRSCFGSYSSELLELVSALEKLRIASNPMNRRNAIDEAGQCYCTLLVALASKGLTLPQLLRDQTDDRNETSWSDVSSLSTLLQNSASSDDLLRELCLVPDLSSSVRKNPDPSTVRLSARAMIQSLTGLLGNQRLSLVDVMSLEQRCQDYVSLR